MNKHIFPVYIKNNAIINDVSVWVKLILLCKKMRKRVNNEGMIEYYKRCNDIIVIYDIKEKATRNE
jgi:hypothetical protein